MKAHAGTHKIVGQPGAWVVVEKATNKVVAGPFKTFKGVRTAHARITLGIPHRVASRLGNG